MLCFLIVKPLVGPSMDLCEGSLPALHSTALQCPLQCSAALQLLPGCSVTPLLDCLIDGGAPQYYFNLCHWPRASTHPIKCIYNVIFTFYPTTRTSQHRPAREKKVVAGAMCQLKNRTTIDCNEHSQKEHMNKMQDIPTQCRHQPGDQTFPVHCEWLYSCVFIVRVLFMTCSLG